MSKQFETGHAKNVANLLKYNQYLATLGVTYNPPSKLITLASLEALYTAAKARLDALNQAQDLWKAETNNREIAFDALGAFGTRLLGVLRSTDTPQQTINDLSALVTKLRGDSKKTAHSKEGLPPVAPAGDTVPEAAITRSSSRQSFDQRLENFSKIVLLLQGVIGYTPNEADLNIAGLQARYNLLIDLNTRATNADAALKNARTERNSFLYAPETGMLELVKKSKAYLLGLYGRDSEQYKKANTYKFAQALR